MKRLFIVSMFITVGCFGFIGGRLDRNRAVGAAREAEYVRVVSAIARTMRCSTVEEFERGADHECDPSEIEQDAGLVDTITEDDPRWDCRTMGNKVCGQAKSY